MKGEAVVVQTSPTMIAGSNGTGTAQAGSGSVAYPTGALIRIPSGAPTIWFGHSTVTSTTGCPFVAGEDLEVDLVNEILYAVTATTTATVYILRRGD